MTPSIRSPRDPKNSDGAPSKTKSKAIFLALLVLFGTFGIHRYYLGVRRSASIMLGLSVLQDLILAFTFMKIFAAPWVYYLWPPYCAVANFVALWGMLAPAHLGASADFEAKMVQPLLWTMTIPSVITTGWALIDLARFTFNRSLPVNRKSAA